jgi:hypothetical protein
VKKLAIAAALALAGGGAAFAQNAPASAGARPEQPAPAFDPAVPAGLSDLEKRTFACPRAALNAARDFPLAGAEHCGARARHLVLLDRRGEPAGEILSGRAA